MNEPAGLCPITAQVLRGQHREAIAACARDYGAAVGRLCMSLLGDQAEAEETVQEAMIAAFDSFGSWRGEGSIKAWLYGIARRMCARRLAKRVRREKRLRLVHDAGADSSLPDELLERRQRGERVRAALDELKPSDREALLLRYESVLDYREIGSICGIDETTARKRTSRALGRLRDVLQLQGSLS